MNIDVREYLRINPISVHELSLSDNGNDCFLFFPLTQAQRGYKVFTQTQLFLALQKTIFGDLLDYDTTPPTIRPVDCEPPPTLKGQFKNYVRRVVAEGFMRDFDSRVLALGSRLDDIIMVLRRKGLLEYDGAVELQSVSTRTIPWETTELLGVKLETPLYVGMSYAEGQIWCRSNGSTLPLSGGKDEIEIDEPLQHDHVDTMAETLTGPLARNYGGGQLVGDFTVGSQELFSQGEGYGPASGTVSPLEHVVQETEALTYPLWGQNVLDWRTPKKEHNNVPPSLNIYVRFLELA